MSRRRDKIDTGGGEALGNNPFAGLEVSVNPADRKGPSGPTDPKKEKKKPARRVELRREKAGRGGKTVTTLREFPPNIPLRELEVLCRDLKKACACGGVLKGRAIELQGDVRERIEPLLEKTGYRPVRAGG